ncbi:hypothetical protein BZA77DRAFT_357818 [Pyronema omphalodes]|nr:hypothetical protein BZA77DRAFT_357818 [Pyronema omphalodes]
MKIRAFTNLRRIFRRNRRPETHSTDQPLLPVESSPNLNPITISIPKPVHSDISPQHSAISLLSPLPSNYSLYQPTPSHYPEPISISSTTSLSEFAYSQCSSPVSPSLPHPPFSILSAPPGSPYSRKSESPRGTPYYKNPAPNSTTAVKTLRLLSPSSSALSTVSENSNRDKRNNRDDVNVSIISRDDDIYTSFSSMIFGEDEDKASLSSSCQVELDRDSDKDFSGFSFPPKGVKVKKDKKRAKCHKCGYRLGDGSVNTTTTKKPRKSPFPTSRALAPGSSSVTVSVSADRNESGQYLTSSSGSAPSTHSISSKESKQEVTIEAMLYKLHGVFLKIEKVMDNIEPLVGETEGWSQKYGLKDDTALLMREIRKVIERLEKRGDGRAL